MRVLLYCKNEKSKLVKEDNEYIVKDNVESIYSGKIVAECNCNVLKKEDMLMCYFFKNVVPVEPFCVRRTRGSVIFLKVPHKYIRYKGLNYMIVKIDAHNLAQILNNKKNYYYIKKDE